MTAPTATRRQLNAIAAGLVHTGVAPLEQAGDIAYELLSASGYDVANIQHETVDRQKPFLYAVSSDEREG
ncbi:hypothetical protein MARCHEWKA_02610 [Brevundimonas phage vB_BpoS-Marchewka]|uniref:Uncharacterized protein n=1 Tax=Brevundimonas phage vB_BpoS-Marchewka TaxID=2948604 RepID=A0A9E7SQW2_9CAUD|nr:hypothetical protein MARCHEWKA_02610 [Brevundimonas phage vB_BpoS-Marchewka]